MKKKDTEVVISLFLDSNLIQTKRIDNDRIFAYKNLKNTGLFYEELNGEIAPAIIGISGFGVLYISPKLKFTFEYCDRLDKGYYYKERPERVKNRKELYEIIKEELKESFNNCIKYYNDNTKKYEEY